MYTVYLNGWASLKKLSIKIFTHTEIIDYIICTCLRNIHIMFMSLSPSEYDDVLNLHLFHMSYLKYDDAHMQLNSEQNWYP